MAKLFMVPCLVLAVTNLIGSSVFGQDFVRLHEAIPAGHQYHVSSRVELSGSLQPPGVGKGPKQIQISGVSSVEYDERVLDGDSKGPVQKTLRVYRQMDFRRKVGEQQEESTLRPDVRRMVLLRFKQSEVPFSPDGPLTWAEIDRVRTDVFTPALAALLPEKDVKPGAYWNAGAMAVEELTDLDQITDGKIECKFEEIVTKNGRRFAQISFKGTVSGRNEDGPNRQQLDGHFFFDLQSHHLSYLFMNGTSLLLDKDGQPGGKIEGRYVLTRRLENSTDLHDDVVKKLNVEPNAENTKLLFDEPALGVRFLYSRRWTVRQADARQILFDEPQGGGLVITLDPLTKTPSVIELQAEVNTMLAKQSAKTIKTDTARKLRFAPDELEQFRYEVEMNKDRLVLDYYLVRQAGGGATFAGRYPVNDAKALQEEVEAIARSLKLIPPKK